MMPPVTNTLTSVPASAASRGEAAPAAGETTARKPFQIPSLDGLRAVSFLIVFLGHAFTKRWIPGDLGLIVFFFLSGYLITTLLRLEYDETGGINFRDFYLRRVLRIFPPLYLVLGAGCLLTLTHVLDNTLWPRAVLAQACHLTNYWIVFHGWWNGMAPGSWIFWSLAVEEHFYLVFPFDLPADAPARADAEPSGTAAARPLRRPACLALPACLRVPRAPKTGSMSPPTRGWTRSSSGVFWPCGATRLWTRSSFRSAS